MTARWHLGPITGFHLWWVLVTSPEVLVFLFFMITDPKTAPRSPRARLVYAVSLGLLASVLIAPTTTEFAAKVALLGALTIVCVAMPVLRARPVPVDRRLLLAGAPAAAALAAAAIVLANAPAGATAFRPLPHGVLPPITILPSHGVQTKLDLHTAQLDRARPARDGARQHERHRCACGSSRARDRVRRRRSLSWRAGRSGSARSGRTGGCRRTRACPPMLGPVPQLPGYRLDRRRRKVGIRFREGAFRYGVTSDTPAMMGGGLCWLDYNNDGWLDLFAVNSYGEGDIGAYWEPTAGYRAPRSIENGAVTSSTSALDPAPASPLRGEGCVAADLNGDGHTDLFVTTAQDDVLLWNNGDGTFTEGARKAGIVSFGWHSGAAVADVNGDGRPDLFVAGYTEPNGAIPELDRRLPDEPPGVRDELFLNEGNGHFREVGRQAGLDPQPYDHGLGAVFTDVNGDGRPDLYVANDEDPNKLYLNVKGGPLGFHFVDRRRARRRCRPERRHGDRGSGRPPLREQLARPDARVLPAGRSWPVRAGRHGVAVRGHRRLGRELGRPQELAARPISCSRTDRSP